MCSLLYGSAWFGSISAGILDSGWDCARGMFPPKSAPRDPLNYILEPWIKEKTREQAEQQETLELGTIS